MTTEQSDKQTKTKLEQIRDKKEAMLKRYAAMEAREMSQERKADTRRKILLGAIAESLMKSNQTVGALFDAEIKKLQRPHDREVFGLPALTPAADAKTSAPASESAHDTVISARPVK